MNQAAATEDDATSASLDESFLRRHPRLRRELFIFGWTLATGLFVVPTLVYVIGLLTLGPYASGGWGALFLNLYKGLFQGWWAAWGIVLGPLLLVYFLRSVLFLYRRFLRSPGDPDS